MAQLAIIATIRTPPGQRDAYLKHLQAHAARCRTNDPGTLQFEILIPEKEAETILLYEVYASNEALQAHLNGPSMQQMRRDAEHIKVSLTYVRGILAPH